MRFQATVVFELQASSIGEAGQKLQELITWAKEREQVEAKDIDLRTPPAQEPVVLPTLPPRERRPPRSS